ncbi:conserved hypothetical protein [Bradyrhizobium sp. ORS 375]|uniref:hypothetical protein n=1 Tax=Bradyrhizobium sp. (strain ORS 375) TaxID=566679 RepID=UPI0002409B67|nr:hypothetical protein [Bradyrhizobium sp. ORS 375]CCD91037.1 conserved hypothetical protein [Bradyrhizobium sp. ORS 375]
MFGVLRSEQRALRRRRAVRRLFCHHRADRTPAGRARRLLQQWLTPAQWKQFSSRGYFDVTGSDSGRRYRIFTGSAMNVCLLDERGRTRRGICFVPVGDLPAGDVMLAQKLALELCEDSALMVAREFIPRALG